MIHACIDSHLRPLDASLWVATSSAIKAHFNVKSKISLIFFILVVGKIWCLCEILTFGISIFLVTFFLLSFVVIWIISEWLSCAWFCSFSSPLCECCSYFIERIRSYSLRFIVKIILLIFWFQDSLRSFSPGMVLYYSICSWFWHQIFGTSKDN